MLAGEVLGRIFPGRKDDVARARDLLAGFGDNAPRAKLDLPDIVSKIEIFRLAGLDQRGFQKLWSSMGVSLLVVLILVVITKTAWPLALLVGLSFLQFRRLKASAYRRAESFEKDYVALLLSLASAVRTGLDPLVALTEASALFAPTSQVGRELLNLKARIQGGLSEAAAISHFGKDIAHPDIGLFRSAFLLARREGSSLAECLQRLARVTRQRQSFRRKIRAAVALQKVSAFGIVICTGVIGLIQFITNSESVLNALRHPVGSRVLFLGGGLVCLGVVWMLELTRTKI